MREKPNYRTMLCVLMEQFPNTMTKIEACKALNCSRPFLDKLIRTGKIKYSGGKITIGSIASYLCD